jgi:hypothetical protein
MAPVLASDLFLTLLPQNFYTLGPMKLPPHRPRGVVGKDPH